MGDMLVMDSLSMNSFLLRNSVLSKPRTLVPCLFLTMYLALQMSLESLLSAFLLSLLALTHPQSVDVEETS